MGPKGPPAVTALYEDEEEEPGPMEALQTAILENLKHYADRYSEEFQPYLQNFTQDVWVLLTNVPIQPKYDELMVNGVRFLCSLVSRSSTRKLFAHDDTLRSICEQIVIPNIRLRESDMEQFEENPIEYLRRDIEGSDGDTRRYVACELVRALCQQYETQTTNICQGFLQQMLSEYSSNPSENWQLMDSAFTLVIAITVRASTARSGATQITSQEQVMNFLSQCVLPELQHTSDPSSSNPTTSTGGAGNAGPTGSNSGSGNGSGSGMPDPNTRPILKANAIKFVSTFRGFIPADAMRQLLPLLAHLLQSNYHVVHTYAASALERILSIQDSEEGQPPLYTSGTTQGSANALLAKKRMRYGANEAALILEPALKQLMILIHQSTVENEYLMKAVLRLVAVSRQEISPYIGWLLDQLKVIIMRVCGNPSNPLFNHFLFETTAALIVYGGSTNVPNFENKLSEVFEGILGSSITEFMPYAFQLMALLLELHPSDRIPESYENLFQTLLTGSLWMERQNVPALVRLVEAYLEKNAQQVLGNNPESLISGLLGVFQQLLQAKSTEDYSLHLLICISNSVQLNLFMHHLPAILNLIMSRIQKSKALKLAQNFVVFMSALIGRHGVPALSSALDQIQPNLLVQLVQQIWAPHAPNVTGADRRKACVIGSSRLLVEYEILLEQYPDVWYALLSSTMQLLITTSASDASSGIDSSSASASSTTSPGQPNDSDQINEELEKWAEAGHSTGFSKLAFAHTKPTDWFSDIPDSRAYFARHIASFSSSKGQQVSVQVSKLLDQSSARDSVAIRKVLEQAGVSS